MQYVDFEINPKAIGQYLKRLLNSECGTLSRSNILDIHVESVKPFKWLLRPLSMV
jgi:hypothetical protein